MSEVITTVDMSDVPTDSVLKQAVARAIASTDNPNWGALAAAGTLAVSVVFSPDKGTPLDLTIPVVEQLAFGELMEATAPIGQPLDFESVGVVPVTQEWFEQVRTLLRYLGDSLQGIRNELDVARRALEEVRSFDSEAHLAVLAPVVAGNPDVSLEALRTFLAAFLGGSAVDAHISTAVRKLHEQAESARGHVVSITEARHIATARLAALQGGGNADSAN